MAGNGDMLESLRDGFLFDELGNGVQSPLCLVTHTISALLCSAGVFIYGRSSAAACMNELTMMGIWADMMFLWLEFLFLSSFDVIMLFSLCYSRSERH